MHLEDSKNLCQREMQLTQVYMMHVHGLFDVFYTIRPGNEVGAFYKPGLTLDASV